MPITDKSSKDPVLKPQRIGHGTLECRDIVRTRRFYEEVLGIECLQTGPISMMIRLGTPHVYAVVQTKQQASADMAMMNHNGLDVGSPEEVDAAREKLLAIKDDWGIKKILPVMKNHGDHSFYFVDFDGNWWEVVNVRPGGYVVDFNDDDRDITGLHQFDDVSRDFHTHDPAVRARVKAARSGQGAD